MRRACVEAIEVVAAEISPRVSRLMERVTLYSLKHTHLTWARRLVNHDSVRVQMGRAARDVDERHYLDLALVDARESWTHGRIGLERVMGFEPTTSGLGSQRSATELHPQLLARRSTSSRRARPELVEGLARGRR